ncbi:MAG: hypothetical protein ATN31_08780 [Candidatus Epulonipiscioides saccharophilum]|nr:MAG: hypothetical protein ATN31_08780 [Epulopiscium sp. AS2M-Bin001]
MQYRQLIPGGDNLSIIGYGCMRFPSKNGRIDEVLTNEQLLFAYGKGINYFDTAYPYHGGKSEVILGEFIKKNDIRSKVFIADKMPVYLVNKTEQFETFFQTQLKRLDTDYIDYYLMHSLGSLEGWEDLKKLGILEFIDEHKKNGSIRYVGFSFHGKAEEFTKIIDDYNWDFCQIQYNYLDETNQAGTAGLEYAYAKNIGVIVMEPLRGGNLAAKAPTKVKEMIENFEPKRSAAFWALRWIFNHKEVSVVLSGMNNINHIKDNIYCANNTQPDSMTEKELQLIEDIKKVYQELMLVPCTGCNYCMPCPVNVDIPGIFAEYNNNSFFGGIIPKVFYAQKFVGGIMGVEQSGANLCIECGKCMTRCPQNIQIPEKLQAADKALNKKYIIYPTKLAKRFFLTKSKKSKKSKNDQKVNK